VKKKYKYNKNAASKLSEAAFLVVIFCKNCPVIICTAVLPIF
jgi:hypothetical protein